MTDHNRYAAPSAPPEAVEVVGVKSGRREDLRSVAQYQKGVIVCILAQLLAVLAQVVLSLSGEPVGAVMSFAASLFGIVAGLGGMIFVILLAVKVYNTALGILLGILAIVPCLGLIVLLMVNGKATSILKENGIKVGLMGARLSDV